MKTIREELNELIAACYEFVPKIGRVPSEWCCLLCKRHAPLPQDVKHLRDCQVMAAQEAMLHVG